MTATEPDDDGYEDEERSVLSPAYPPLYVLRTADHCPKRGTAMHVYTLGYAAYRDAEDDRPVEDFHFLRLTESVPEALLELINAGCPGFFLDARSEADAAT
jgi:hypothetical protein